MKATRKEALLVEQASPANAGQECKNAKVERFNALQTKPRRLRSATGSITIAMAPLTRATPEAERHAPLVN
jgi:hypothetical protein